MAWENERGIEFLYNGSSLLCMLEEYINLRQEKEQERKRQRDQRRLQGQLMAEQELLLDQKPSPSKPLSIKKLTKALTGRSTKRQSVSFQPLKHDSLSSADDISPGGPGGEDETSYALYAVGAIMQHSVDTTADNHA
ncbi:hypothetical protein HPP92_002830 [Vanilla planifolia]|uniref:Uncharacterized protein n=1 Tax=Vanilla planifolia TaxID=51239 RepID=A0A835RU27_VANPL|nr:hypothetical protein HPP92_002830 [Vanilla planifolia]